MERDFWRERWNRGEIGFHQSDIHWALKRHWDEIADVHAGRVLAPLCGKSLDLRWLAENGHEVTGIELSAKAVKEFFEEWGKQPTQSAVAELTYWRAGGVELVEGDFFAYATNEPFDLFYDRAALIALPHDMRPAYLDHLRTLLTDKARGLLVTFEYDQTEMDGPPFAVLEDELTDYPGLQFQLLERRDVLAQHARFAERGLTALHECAWLAMP
ncbi:MULTISPECIES: thiopurine S-methyltransferase [unclassified Wenzhouxiangella]|uniref:thiopurine S-methyltransferase n=1 Tax=unclassified Wenzhouxiangella TaxID=2613841 RepID=UPI000E32D2DE|nr:MULTISPECIES: thiopurine S-methyltransferase [unclassified Wenzhouxiangella]RFF26877.1 thiopurine S-methyltransferase [Wenzhouxiangella sp. 15181]RFP68469.1 thiopurine S-methyltransferase [Wenzhouxiangella sp. 15190]